MVVPADGANDLPISLLLQVVEILSIVGGGGWAVFKLGRNTAKMESAIVRANEVAGQQKGEMGELKQEVRELGKVLTQMAITTTRLDAMSERVSLLDRRYEELSHGEGFVYPLGSHLPGRSGT